MSNCLRGLRKSRQLENWNKQKIITLGRGCGLMVRVLAFYYYNPSSNPADACSFFCKMFEKNENNQKVTWVAPQNNYYAKYVFEAYHIS